MLQKLQNWIDENIPEGSDELSSAVLASWAGGQAAHAFYKNKDLKIEEKAKNDPVTEADLASEAAIFEILKSRSNLFIRSEESTATDAVKPGEDFWVVDPLDGTKDFIEQTDEFCAMIGLAENGRAKLGAVYAPALDLLFFGQVGLGSWAVVFLDDTNFNVIKIQVSERKENELIVVGSRSHAESAVKKFVESIKGAELIAAGSVGIKCAKIATGDAHLYVHPVPYLKEWDTCAPEAILRGAGGKVTGTGGEELLYGKDDPKQKHGIFAAPEEIHSELMQDFASSTKQ